MRRSVVFLLIVIACLPSACSSLGADVLLGRDIHFSAPQLQAQLDRKFPRDYKKLGGLLKLSLLNPRFTLPGGGRLRLEPTDDAYAARQQPPAPRNAAEAPILSGGDVRDLLIAQQVRRIDELEREVAALRAELHCE